ncbi:MAG: hypothetical protein NTZ83_00105 [Candidatus Pacearchaeota archaeon]|nr:hypothetical protein [Candidatus Pacearchaeota archaeon]
MEKKKSSNFQNYAFANVGATMSKSKADAMYIPGAVDLLEKNLEFGEDGKDLYDWFVTEKATNKLIDIYNKKFYSKLSEATVADVYSWYTPALTNITDEQKALVDAAFGKYAGENYAKLKGKIGVLQHKLETPEGEGGISDEEKEKIQKELQPYMGFILAESLVSKYSYENLRFQAVEASKPHSFGGLEEVLKKAEADPEKK